MNNDNHCDREKEKQGKTEKPTHQNQTTFVCTNFHYFTSIIHYLNIEIIIVMDIEF